MKLLYSIYWQKIRFHCKMLSSKSLYTTRQALRCPALQSQVHLQRGLSTSSALSKGTAGQGPKALLLDKQQGLGFAKSNALPPKPRKRGVTEIRGPYYAVRLQLMKKLTSCITRWFFGLGNGKEISLWYIWDVRVPLHVPKIPNCWQLNSMGDYVDGLKFSGGWSSLSIFSPSLKLTLVGSFSLFHEAKLKELIDIAHENGAYVSTVSLLFIHLVK